MYYIVSFIKNKSFKQALKPAPEYGTTLHNFVPFVQFKKRRKHE